MNLVLDANSNIPESFVFGNNFWFKSSQVCDLINEPVQISLSPNIPKRMSEYLLNSTSPVPVKYQLIYANFTSPMQIDVKFHVYVSIKALLKIIVVFRCLFSVRCLRIFFKFLCNGKSDHGVSSSY